MKGFYLWDRLDEFVSAGSVFSLMERVDEPFFGTDYPFPCPLSLKSFKSKHAEVLLVAADKV